MSFLENNILEKHYVQGEILFDAGAVLEVLELEKHLWSIMIKDNGILEVEIQHPNTKTQKSTCECNTFSEEKSCAHIATALLFLRKKESEKKQEKKKATIQKQQFNLKTIIENINVEDLKKFIKTHAQSDRSFNIALKAAFARKIDLADNSLKYESILSPLIKPISTEQNTSSSADLRLAIKVIEEFNAQLEDALSLNQLDEAFLILETCLPKLHYLYSNYNKRTDKIIQLLSTYHTHIDELYMNQMAPALLTRLDDLVASLFQKSYYNHLECLENVFHIAEKHHRNTLVETLKLSIFNTPAGKVKQINLVVFTALLIQSGYHEKIRSTDDTIIAAIQYLIKMERGKEAISYMEKIKTSRPKNRKLEFTMATTYLNLNQIEKFQNLSAELYVVNNDARYYRLLKENTPKASWPEIKEIIQNKISEHQPGPEFIGRFYEREGMPEELLNVLKSSLDLRLIMKFDFDLYKSHYTLLEEIYCMAVKQYLEQHAGSIATRFIEEVFFHLNQIRAHKLTTALKQYISDNFPHRSLLSTFS